MFDPANDLRLDRRDHREAGPEQPGPLVAGSTVVRTAKFLGRDVRLRLRGHRARTRPARRDEGREAVPDDRPVRAGGRAERAPPRRHSRDRVAGRVLRPVAEPLMRWCRCGAASQRTWPGSGTASAADPSNGQTPAPEPDNRPGRGGLPVRVVPRSQRRISGGRCRAPGRPGWCGRRSCSTAGSTSPVSRASTSVACAIALLMMSSASRLTLEMSSSRRVVVRVVGDARRTAEQRLLLSGLEAVGPRLKSTAGGDAVVDERLVVGATAVGGSRTWACPTASK